MKARGPLLVGSALIIAGCHTDMWAQPQTRALEPSSVFLDGRSARNLPAGVVPFSPEGSPAFESGMTGGQPVETVPVDETARALRVSGLQGVLERGEERFNVFCSPCHGRLGDGKGMIVQRGLKLFRQPRNLHEDRIVNAPDGHIFRVITFGYGAMFPYGDRIPIADRWAIVSYVRALELSEGAPQPAGGGAGAR